MADHERDLLGRGGRGRHDQVALVLAIVVVDDDDHLAGADRLDRGFDGVELAHATLQGPFRKAEPQVADPRGAVERE